MSGDTLPETSERQIQNYRAILLMVCALILIVVVLTTPMTLPFMVVTTADVVTLLTNIGLIALLVERAVEVTLAVTRAKEKRVLRAQTAVARNRRQESLVYLNNITAQMITPLESGNLGDMAKSAKEELTVMTEEAVKNAKDLAIYTGHTKILSMIYAFTLGIMASALGFRMLEPLVDPIVFKQLQGFHQAIFSGFDVLITGAVLGGGSNGIHKILDTFLSWFDKARGNLKDNL
jgi:hypothetical protein